MELVRTYDKEREVDKMNEDALIWSPLTLIANKYKTDKGTTTHPGHSYTETYYKLFKDMQNEPIRLLEIGVGKGYSLRMWDEFFPNAHIIGMDIKCKNYAYLNKVNLFRGDQGNLVDLAQLIVLYEGDFDIIIDDGSHLPNDHKISFEFLKHYLVSGGLYIIEDLSWEGSTETRRRLAKDPDWYLCHFGKLGVYKKP